MYDIIRCFKWFKICNFIHSNSVHSVGYNKYKIAGFHGNINKINFLLLYEATFIGKWLEKFRQTMKV